MKRPTLTIGAGVGSLVVAALAFTTLGSVFLPQLDEGDLLIQSLRIPATSVQQSQAMQVPIERMMSKDKDLRYATPHELVEDINEISIRTLNFIIAIYGIYPSQS